MSGFGSFEISGADALLSKLKRLANYDDVKTAVKVNTVELTASAKRNAPNDTGFLERSIIPSISDLVGQVNATADYAMYVEKGTRYMAAQPYMGPAYLVQKQKFLSDLQRLMR